MLLVKTAVCLRYDSSIIPVRMIRQQPVAIALQYFIHERIYDDKWLTVIKQS